MHNSDSESADAGSSVKALAALEDVRFSYDGGASWALDGVSLTLEPGEYVCLVGANGSGKSTLARLLAGLTAPDAGRIDLCGQLVFDGMPDAQAYRVARRRIGAVFQNPGDQIIASVVEDDVAFGPENLAVEPSDIGSRVCRSLEAVELQGLEHAEANRMSGGQQQRLAIAGMLAMRPDLMVLDEPTAMLDPTARGEVLAILDELHQAGVTIVHVTHHDDELAHASRILRLDAGRIVADERAPSPGICLPTGAVERCFDYGLRPPLSMTERESLRIPPGVARGESLRTSLGTTGTSCHDERNTNPCHDERRPKRPLFPCHAERRPKHLFFPCHAERRPKRLLFPCHAERSAKRGVEASSPAIHVQNLRFTYPDASSPTVNGVSFDVATGEIVALMGGNGAGKSTLIRLLAALEQPQSGNIDIAGIPVAADKGPHRRQLSRSYRKALRRTLGLVMQHPERQLFAETVRDDVAYGPRNQGLSEAEVAARVDDALELLGIAHLADRSPFHLSGGQQRLAAIAGVIACDPKVLVLDEPTAGLDATAQQRIHTLLTTLRARGVAILLVTHSSADSALADRVLIMAHGRIISDCGADGDSDCLATAAKNQPADDHDSEHASESHDGKTGSPRPRSADSVRNDTKRNTRTDDTETGDNRRALADGDAHTRTTLDLATARDSFVRRLDARVKMVAFLAMMFSAFAIRTPLQLALAAAATLGLIAASRVNPLRLLASLRPLIALLALFALINLLVVRSGTPLLVCGPLAITDQGLAIAGLYAARLMLVVILGALFLETTTPTAVTDGFASLLKPLRRLGVHTQELALVMGLALRFIPTLTAEARAILDAQSARGGSVETGSLPQRLRALGAIIVPVFAGTLRHADNLALALDARCYEEGIERTHWHAQAIRPRDLIFAALAILYIAALVTLPFL